MAMALIAIGWYARGIKDRNFDASYADYIHPEKNGGIFKKADQKKYKGALSEARDAYLKLLNKPLREEEYWYAVNQLTFILLTIRQDRLPPSEMKRFEKMGASLPHTATGALGDYYLNRGMAAYFSDDWPLADSLFHAALTQFRAIYPPDHLRIAQCMVWLGWTNLSRSPDLSQAYLHYAFELFQKNRAWHLGRAECELGMARIEQMQRAYRRGIPYCEAAMHHLATDTLAYSNLFVRALSLRGLLNLKNGDADEAQKDLEESLRLALKTDSPYTEEVFKLLIQNDISQERSVAKFFFRIRELEQFLRDRTPRVAFPDWFRGLYFFKTGDWNNTIVYFEKFLRNMPAPEKIRIDILDNTYFPLIIAYQNTGRYDEATYYGLKELMLGKNEAADGACYTINNGLVYPDIEKCSEYDLAVLALLGRVFLQKYYAGKRELDLVQATVFFSSCDSIYVSKFREKDEDILLQMQSEIVDSCYPYALEATYAQFRRAPNSEWLDQAFKFCEREKAGIMYREMRLVQEESDRSLSALKDSLAAYNNVINRFNLIQESGKSLKFQEQNDLRNIRSRRDSILKSLKNRQKWDKENTRAVIPAVKQVRERLGRKEAVIHYGLGPDKLHILFVTRDTVMFCQVDNAGLIRTKVRELQQILSFDGSTTDAFIETSGWLYRHLLGTLQPVLNRYDHLLLIPDGDLHLIPFEVLVEPFPPQGGKTPDFFTLPYLLRRFSVTYSPSWMVHLNNLYTASFPLINPRVGIWADTTFQVWQEEMEGIRQIWSKQRVEGAIGQSCNLGHFKKNYNRFDIIHLMLHGQTNPDNRLDYKVLFGKDDENWLYGYEVQGFRFNRPKLIVLAVCETALGKNVTGEGASTLSRSFLQAGIPWAVASLGKIDEGSTEIILREFYAQIAQTDKIIFPPDALREAKLAYLRREQQGFRVHPHYWAGLIVQH